MAFVIDSLEGDKSIGAELWVSPDAEERFGTRAIVAPEALAAAEFAGQVEVLATRLAAVLDEEDGRGSEGFATALPAVRSGDRAARKR